jgi:3-keto-disaccharide hydrolase
MHRSLLHSVVLTLFIASVSVAADNQLTNAEKDAGWRLLFNGKDLTGWRCNNDKPIATKIEDGCLVPYQSGGYLIIHEDQFGDFVLKCDVRWEDPRCNSGIFFRVEDPRNPIHTGFEAQVMAGDGTGKHDMGAIYDLVGPTESASRGTGQWNSVEVRCQGAEISIKVNGELVSELNCNAFDKPGVCPDGQAHKFTLNGKPRAVKDFARSGYLGFQDHGHKVWYKNVKLLALKK